MSFLKELSTSFSSFHKAHVFIKVNKLRPYVLLPGLINLALFLGSAIAGWYLSDSITTYLLDWMGVDLSSDGTWAWVQTILNFFFLVLFRIMFFLAYLYSFKYIILIIMSPVLAYLSERTEAILTKRTYKFEWGVFIKQTFRGISIAIVNALMELGLLLLLYLFASVPMLGLISPVLIFFVQSYFYGFSMLDYYFERQNLGIGESIGRGLKYKQLALANGATFYALLIVPIIGVMVAPTYSVVAAGIALHQIKQHELEG